MNHKISSEERANVWTHVPGIVGTLLVAPFLLHMAAMRGWTYVLGIVLFLIGMLLMYSASTFYHLIPPSRAKRVLRVLDHIAIYAMIAGSYSLICTAVLGGWMGWTLFVFLWSCVVAGIVGKIFWLGKHPRLSLTLYLVMGWVALLVIYPMWCALPRPAFWWIVGEGIAYSVGAYFFRGDEKHAYWHAVWHVFILLGSLCHTIACFYILLYFYQVGVG